VVEPPLTSPAGAGVLLHGHPDRGFEIMDFFATTPGRGLSSRPPLDFERVTVDFGSATQPFHVGRAAAAIPGALPGLLATHQAYGTLPLRDILAPAIAYARHGYQLSTQVRWVNELLRPIVTLTKGVRDIFCDGDDLAPAASTQTNPAFADFLEALAANPRDARRHFDAAILRAFGPQNGGLITAEDLAAYQPTRRQPLRTSFHGAEILTNPPPASGGGLIAFALRLLETMDLGPFLSAQHLTSMAETFRAVSEARLAGYDANISDPETVAALLSDSNVDSWARRIAARREENQLGGTTHISVLDADGGAAAMTASNGEGCGYVLPDLGVHMNNFLGEEDINPLGFHQFEAGTRMTTMMAPTLVLRNGAPHLVLGSGGSNRIRIPVSTHPDCTSRGTNCGSKATAPGQAQPRPWTGTGPQRHGLTAGICSSAVSTWSVEPPTASSAEAIYGAAAQSPSPVTVEREPAPSLTQGSGIKARSKMWSTVSPAALCTSTAKVFVPSTTRPGSMKVDAGRSFQPVGTGDAA
jgi:gamma-glutamyltranspeptidase/glutathione hydrolase